MRNVVEYANMGKEKVYPQIDFKLTELDQLLKVAKEKDVTSALITAYYAGVEIGSRIKTK